MRNMHESAWCLPQSICSARWNPWPQRDQIHNVKILTWQCSLRECHRLRCRHKCFQEPSQAKEALVCHDWPVLICVLFIEVALVRDQLHACSRQCWRRTGSIVVSRKKIPHDNHKTTDINRQLSRLRGRLKGTQMIRPSLEAFWEEEVTFRTFMFISGRAYSSTHIIQLAHLCDSHTLEQGLIAPSPPATSRSKATKGIGKFRKLTLGRALDEPLCSVDDWNSWVWDQPEWPLSHTQKYNQQQPSPRYTHWALLKDHWWVLSTVAAQCTPIVLRVKPPADQNVSLKF